MRTSSLQHIALLFLLLVASSPLTQAATLEAKLKEDEEKTPEANSFFQSRLRIPTSREYDSLYTLEGRLLQGDKTVLLDIAPYFDSNKRIITALFDFKDVEGEIARDIVNDNCLFTDEEFVVNEKTTAEDFRTFIDKQKDALIFSSLACAFVLTPLDKRTVHYEIRELSEKKKIDYRKQYLRLVRISEEEHALVSKPWKGKDTLLQLIEQRNPYCLLYLASQIFQTRSRIRSCRTLSYSIPSLLNILFYLTGSEIGVENEKHLLSWHIEYEHDYHARLHLLIYCIQEYSNYKWDETVGHFVHQHSMVRPLYREEEFFEDLSDSAHSSDAMLFLSMCDPNIVATIAQEEERLSMYYYYTLPDSSYRLLTQLSLLTHYCDKHGIDFRGSDALRENIKLLQSELSFVQRRTIENHLLATLQLDDITAFEYWALFGDKDSKLKYSAGRIVDLFYSQHWRALLADKHQLDCYLMKSKLFSQTGSKGICNNYLYKFRHADSATLKLLKEYSTPDSIIREQALAALEIKNNTLHTRKERTRVRNVDMPADMILTTLQRLTSRPNSSDDEDIEIIESLLPNIRYQQIPSAIKCMEECQLFNLYLTPCKFSFMNFGWNFCDVGKFQDARVRHEFLALYEKLSQEELYRYYLDRAGIDYQKTDGNLDYDKIYDILKYNVAPAFRGLYYDRDNEVHFLIKILEQRFRTTLGYPNDVYLVYDYLAEEQAQDWRAYLEQHHVLERKHDEPPSFHEAME